MSFLNKIKFAELTQHLEALSNIEEPEDKEEIIQNFIKTLISLHLGNNQNALVSPLFRLLLASEEESGSFDSDRLKFLLSSALDLDEQESERIMSSLDDGFEEDIFKIAQSKVVEESSVFISEIDEFLNKLSEDLPENEQETEFKKIISGMSALDVKWIFKIILKRATDLFAGTDGLKNILDLMASMNHKQESLEIMKFCPYMMPAGYFSATEDNHPFQKVLYVDEYLDAERFQFHIERLPDGKAKVVIFDEEGVDCTSSFNMNFDKFLAENTEINSIILDGGIMGLDESNGEFYTRKFSDVRDIESFAKHGLPLIPIYKVIDILFLNNITLIEFAYEHRIEILKKIFESDPDLIHKPDPILIKDQDEMPRMLHELYLNGEYKIVLKEADSKYLPGGTSGWWSIRTNYLSNIVPKKVNVIAIGGFFESKEDKTLKKKFLVGSVDKSEEGYFTVTVAGSVESGWSEEQEHMILTKLQNSMVEKDPEEDIIKFKGGEIKFEGHHCDVWFPPEETMIMGLKVTEYIKVTEDYADYQFDEFITEPIDYLDELELCVNNNEMEKFYHYYKLEYYEKCSCGDTNCRGCPCTELYLELKAIKEKEALQNQNKNLLIEKSP